MTREEEIRQAAIEANIVSAFSMNGKPPPSPFFMIGAKWADENPDERMIAKYLYEKKGYPIDLNGNLPSFEETMKDVEKYNKYKEDKFIEKACEWIKEKWDDNYTMPIIIDSVIDEFKNYMKGE